MVVRVAGPMDAHDNQNTGVRANADWLFWVSQLHTLQLPLHLPKLGLLRLQEILSQVLDVNEWPRVLVSMPDCLYLSVLRWVPCCHV